MNSLLRFAPYSIDELVDAANSLLAHRPRLALSRRTVRYYIAEGVLKPPDGPPKMARYQAEHLLRLVGVRCLQDRGFNLKDAADQIESLLRSGPDTALIGIDELVQGEQMPPIPSRERPSIDSQSVVRIRLQGGSVLEVPQGCDVDGAIAQAAWDLMKLANKNSAKT